MYANIRQQNQALEIRNQELIKRIEGINIQIENLQLVAGELARINNSFNSSNAALRGRVNELKKLQPEIKEWFSQSVPPNVTRVLNDSRTRTSSDTPGLVERNVPSPGGSTD